MDKSCKHVSFQQVSLQDELAPNDKAAQTEFKEITIDSTNTEEEEEQTGKMLYSLEESPEWYMCLLLGGQVTFSLKLLYDTQDKK